MKSAGFRPPRAVNVPVRGGAARNRRRLGRKVGGIGDLGRRLRRNEVVLKLQNLRHVSNRIAGLRVDGHAQQVVSGAVDEVAVGIELEVAAARIVGHAAEYRHVVDNAGRLLHIEEAGAADRHIGRDRVEETVPCVVIVACAWALTPPAACWSASCSAERDPRSWCRCPCSRWSTHSRCCRKCSGARMTAPAGRKRTCSERRKYP